MVLNKPPTTGDVIVLKLVSGEEVITKLVENSSDLIKISKPIVLSLAGNPISKESGVVPMPWSLSIDDNVSIDIKRDKIIFISKARKEIINIYMRITSNLIVPPVNFTNE